GIFEHFAVGFIQFAKGLFGAAHFRRFVLFAGNETIVLWAIETDAFGISGCESLRHLPANINGHSRFTTGASIVKVTSQPAVRLDFFGVAGGLPNLGRAEMGTIGIGIADAL